MDKVYSVPELIELAIEKDDTFNQKYTYWTQTRGKKADFEWLMPLLEDALGRSFLQDNARKLIAQVENDTEENKD